MVAGTAGGAAPSFPDDSQPYDSAAVRDLNAPEFPDALGVQTAAPIQQDDTASLASAPSLVSSPVATAGFER